MKQGIIYGGTFLFAFVIVTGLLIYLNSSYENIFKFDLSPKSIVQLSDSTKTNSLETPENSDFNPEPDTTVVQDSILLASMGGEELIDSLKNGKSDSVYNKKTVDKQDHKIGKEIIDPITNQTELIESVPQGDTELTQNTPKGKQYTEWIQKVTSIYASMEPKKAAKIIQTYSDNVARDILYTMNKKTAAKVVSEFNPETANRIFRYE